MAARNTLLNPGSDASATASPEPDNLRRDWSDIRENKKASRVLSAKLLGLAGSFFAIIGGVECCFAAWYFDGKNTLKLKLDLLTIFGIGMMISAVLICWFSRRAAKDPSSESRSHSTDSAPGQNPTESHRDSAGVRVALWCLFASILFSLVVFAIGLYIIWSKIGGNAKKLDECDPDLAAKDTCNQFHYQLLEDRNRFAQQLTPFALATFSIQICIIFLSFALALHYHNNGS
eukprot:CAMPEP_0194758312 /NCGR_PEP_ID=MMETSP0323_2-20130528/11615_1 /TAXON_ID=2866 ORGANISM="Crypthecodinium cohnii, Strain Seligo" /NCGR_SAMPLE_ID=MMETSP0323_2 /ASSEMBLY_ACC=CAM_ASM_000346 /LENGTH=231 /DNA_ID=CAMNT_0039678591 /DNA_START=11 /DNA_END=706 /DNA_ORIENTATION=-